MKKLLIVILATIMALFCLTACTLGGTGDAGENTDKIESGNSDNSGNGSSEQEEITQMYLTVNENKIEVTLAENSAVDALVERLRQGDITYTANDYGGFEKVGSLGFSLPRSDTQITTEAGDVILYSGNQIVLFYGSNSYSYTRLGKINGYTATQLRTLLAAGEGSIQVTISLK